MLGLSPAHLLIACVVIVLLFRHRLPSVTWRFSTRDLLIIMTTAAVTMALMAYALRK